MNDVIFNSRTADKFVVRLPDGLRDEVDAIAVEQSTSMNSIFIRSVRQFMAGQRRQDLLLDALEQRLAMVDAGRVNQIAQKGENVNQAQNQQQNIPKVIPANWSDAQVLDFCSVAFRHVVVEGDLKFSDINDALRYMADKGEPAFLREFDMDEHARMAADARRYRWLRDRDCIEDVDRDLMVLRGDTHFTGTELDKEIDNSIRLDVLEAEPCKP
ncbi:Arc family DNA-binding protein [Pseudomonas capsici]|uniref:Arc family DNA-binding protein n=1 Tax=Pseudomonas capsici TaxID=2810614 RepID=UPI0021F10A74|nr:Arc family DNA-binding protein [Pseudomonas capsici]MCV4290860.1 Arc family DNA-binding protein [Pseudomonas capsici]